MDIPKYLVIKKEIIERINSGFISAGEKLKSQAALEEEYNVSRITIKRVLSDLKNEGYIVNLDGKRGFFVRETTSDGKKYIAVLLGDITNYYDSNLLTGIEEELQKNGYNPIICNSGRNSMKILNFMNSLDLDSLGGIIFIPTIENDYDEKNKHIIQYFINKNLKYVLIDQKVSSFNSNIVSTNHRDSSFRLVDYFIKNKKKNILIGSGLECYSINQRISGIKDAFEYNNLPFDSSCVISLNDSHYPMDNDNYSEEFENLKNQIKSFGQVDAFFALNNRILNIFVKAFLSLGYDVNKIALGLHNELNKPVPPYTDKISYIDPHLKKTGRISAKLLINAINDDENNVNYSAIIDSTLHLQEL